jgi:hypothetical protein
MACSELAQSHNPDVRARDKLAGSPYFVHRSNEYC